MSKGRKNKTSSCGESPSGRDSLKKGSLPEDDETLPFTCVSDEDLLEEHLQRLSIGVDKRDCKKGDASRSGRRTDKPKGKSRVKGDDGIMEPRKSESGTSEEGLLLKGEMPKNVLYYGWFFSTNVSLFLKELSSTVLLQCLKVPQFSRFMDDLCNCEGASKDPSTFYRYPRKQRSSSDFQHHLTAKFLGREPLDEYTNFAQRFVGRKFYLRVKGFFFSPKTCGMRIALTEGQRRLFDEREGQTSTDTNKPYDKNDITLIEKELEDPPYHPKVNKSPSSIPTHDCQILTLMESLEDKYSVTLIPSSPEPKPLPSRAHITIGCAPKVPPVQTGLDLLDIVDLEGRADTNSSGVFVKDYSVGEGTLRQFGRYGDAFVLYLCHEIITEATFNYFI